MLLMPACEYIFCNMSWLLVHARCVCVAITHSPLMMQHNSAFVHILQFWWAVGSMFGALLALGVMNTLGWHWYLGLAAFPLFLVLFIFPVSYLHV